MPCDFLIGHDSKGTVVRLVGRGTMQESPAFRAAVEPNLNAGLVVFDAARCEYLDSTFLGCLVGIKKECEHHPACRFVIAASEATRDKLFSSTYLDQYFDFIDESPVVDGQFAPVDIATLEPEELGKHVMRCHERLATVGGGKAAAFQEVADQLARELGERPSKDNLKHSNC